MMRALIVALGLVISTVSLAADPGEEVVIRNDGDKTFYEYRRGGQVVEIKVVPKYGKPYYLKPAQAKDAEDGQYIQSDAPDVAVPSWVIFRW